MFRFRALVPIVLAVGTGGCSCFTGLADMRLAPRIQPGTAGSAPAQRGALAHGFAASRQAPPAAVPRGAEHPAPTVTRSDTSPTPASWLNATSAARFADLPGAAAPQEYRDPQRAFCIACLVAGGGHFYAGETTRGAAILGTAVAGLLGGALLSAGDDDGCDYDFETHECRDASSTPMLIGAGIAAGSWIVGILDSRASAARANARNRAPASTGLGFEAAPLLRLPTGERAVGVRMRLSF